MKKKVKKRMWREKKWGIRRETCDEKEHSNKKEKAKIGLEKIKKKERNVNEGGKKSIGKKKRK